MKACDYFKCQLVLDIPRVGALLGRATQRELDEATMLPFVDDPEVARRVERDTGRSTSGCACPGACDGRCEHLGERLL